MTDRPRSRPVRENAKIFLAGRTCRIQWLDDEGPTGDYICLFANAGWIRVEDIKTGKEFVSPASAVWRIENVHEKA